ncbi:hypothetical protein [Devosia sp. Root635]|uniref:hypothetical protein n=1 Tax=Devosia sp. Root635 TaxID=1736575 RepID=UPI0006FEB81B|nr:hypothetical protein [Devosia sp. Root635]KRA45700.1 hypothetical protein ASD80_05080 [Devosia sp. Root635]
MNYVLAVVILLIWLAAVLRQRRLLPGIVVASILAVNILSFYLIQFLQLADLIHIEHSYKYKRIYLGDEYPFLLTVGGLLVAICAPYILGAVDRPKQLDGAGGQPSMSANQPVLIFVLACFILTIFHAITTNLAFLGEYTIYLQFRDPANLNITNDLVAFFHGNMGAVGILLGVIIATSGRKSLYTAFMALFPYFYIVAFQAASISRWLILQLAIPAVILAFRTRFRWPLLALIILSMVPLYGSLRVVREDNVLGVDALVSSMFDGTSVNSGFIVDSIGNIFGAGLNVSEAQGKVDVTFPLNFNVLSFSPLPSSIDGFDDWRQYTQWINIYGPFNVFSELYWMGVGWYILFVLLMVVTVRWNDKVDMFRRAGQLTPLLAGLANVLLYYGVLLTTQYPLRSAMRWPEISALLAFLLVSLALRTQRRRTVREARQNRPANARPV